MMTESNNFTARGTFESLRNSPWHLDMLARYGHRDTAIGMRVRDLWDDDDG